MHPKKHPKMNQKWSQKRAKPQPRPERPPGTRKRSQNGLPWPPFGLPLAPLWPPLASLWPSFGSLSPLSGHSWFPFRFLRPPVATPWLPEAPLGLPFGCPVTRSTPKLYQNGSQNPRNQARDRKQQKTTRRYARKTNA